MIKNGYQLIDTKSKDLEEGLKYIKKDKILKKYYLNFKKNGKGTNKRLSDPTKPENWSATDTSKNIRLKFKDTPDYKRYMKELKNITKIIKK